MDGSKAPSDDKKRFIRLLQGLKAAYTSPNFMPDEEAVKVWYAMLRDIPYEILSLAAQHHIATSQYPPTIAELRAGCAEIMCEDLLDWTEAWAKVLEVVSAYGVSNGREGVKQLDGPTAEAVRRVGYWAICNSENISVERANFRAAYEQIVAREKKSKVIPQPLQAQIEETRKKLLENNKILVDKNRNADYNE